MSSIVKEDVDGIIVTANNGHKPTADVAIMRSLIHYKLINETAYHFETSEELCIVLESARINQTRIRLHYGDIYTGEDWDDVESGIVYRTADDIKLPKLYLGINTVGGSPILDHRIVKISAYGGQILYKHFAYFMSRTPKKTKRQRKFSNVN